MGDYGESKRKSIAKSILPSTRRKAARDDRKAIHRAARHADNQQIRSFLGDWDDYDGSIGVRDAGRGQREEHAIRYMMYERRLGDKLGAAKRWGASFISAIPNPHQRLGELRKAFPDNLIGRHVVSHLQDLSGIPEENPFRYRGGIGLDRLDYDETWDAYFLPDWRVRRRSFRMPFAMEEVVADALRKVCATGRLSQFNNHLRNALTKQHKVYRDSDRKLWVVQAPPEIIYLPSRSGIPLFIVESGIRTNETFYQAVMSFFPRISTSRWDPKTNTVLPFEIELPT